MQIVNVEAQKRFLELQAEEDSLVFDSFSRADALAVGLKLLDLAKAYPDPVAVEIVINGLVVFRHFADGAMPDSDLWLSRKRNSVELMAMSSLRFKAWLDRYDRDLVARKLDPNDYAAGGGGLPIVLRGTGMVGSVCISGLPNDLDDHALVVAALTALKQGHLQG